ncbi:MAG TPA: ATP-dependent metallopeptidase FtsH/Yme1/Tma family protein, partial [Allosphingosinicella sp.]
MAQDPKSPDKEPGSSNPWVKSLLIWVGILLGLVLFVQMVEGSRTPAQGMSYSEFLRRVDEGSVKQVSIGKEVIQGQ